jgi:NAD(P)-dependent dehydrogenase (short-subunit alcohol dehydrogenase family)
MRIATAHRTALVPGATDGLGRAVARALADTLAGLTGLEPRL